MRGGELENLLKGLYQREGTEGTEGTPHSTSENHGEILFPLSENAAGTCGNSLQNAQNSEEHRRFFDPSINGYDGHACWPEPNTSQTPDLTWPPAETHA